MRSIGIVTQAAVSESDALPDGLIVKDVVLAPREHLAWLWLPWREAADRGFSWSNAEAIRELPQRIAVRKACP